MAIVRIDAYRTTNFATITGSFTTVGAALTKNWRMFRIVNNTNGDLIFSVDGTTNNLFVPANSFVLYDCATNAPPIQSSDTFVFAIGTQFYVKSSTAPTSGDVYIEGIYAQGV
jgi:hypothetical protein